MSTALESATLEELQSNYPVGKLIRFWLWTTVFGNCVMVGYVVAHEPICLKVRLSNDMTIEVSPFEVMVEDELTKLDNLDTI